MTTKHDENPDTTTKARTSEGDGRLPARLSRTIAAVLTVILIISVAVAGWFLYQRGEVEAALGERADAARAAEEFIVTFNTYDSESVDEYLKALKPMLTTSTRTDFEAGQEDTITLIRETELESQGELLASGVSHVDQDDATVLVFADALASSPAGDRQRHFRWEITLNKVDGEWLVDDFDAVRGQGAP